MSGYPGESLQFLGTDPQEIGDPLRSGIHLEPGTQFRVLRGNAHGTFTGAADAVLLTGGGNQRGRGNGNGVGTHGQRFGKVCRDPQPAGDD